MREGQIYFAKVMLFIPAFSDMRVELVIEQDSGQDCGNNIGYSLYSQNAVISKGLSEQKDGNYGNVTFPEQEKQQCRQ